MALKLDNQTVEAQAATTYAPKDDALYLTLKRGKFGHYGSLSPTANEGEQATAFAAFGKLLLSGEYVDISVRPSRKDPENLTLRLSRSSFVPGARSTLAERLTAHLNS